MEDLTRVKQKGRNTMKVMNAVNEKEFLKAVTKAESKCESVNPIYNILKTNLEESKKIDSIISYLYKLESIDNQTINSLTDYINILQEYKQITKRQGVNLLTLITSLDFKHNGNGANFETLEKNTKQGETLRVYRHKKTRVQLVNLKELEQDDNGDIIDKIAEMIANKGIRKIYDLTNEKQFNKYINPSIYEDVKQSIALHIIQTLHSSESLYTVGDSLIRYNELYKPINRIIYQEKNKMRHDLNILNHLDELDDLNASDFVSVKELNELHKKDIDNYQGHELATEVLEILNNSIESKTLNVIDLKRFFEYVDGYTITQIAKKESGEEFTQRRGASLRNVKKSLDKVKKIVLEELAK